MKYAINIGFVLAALGIVFGLLGPSEVMLMVGAIFYGSSTIALAIQSKS